MKDLVKAGEKHFTLYNGKIKGKFLGPTEESPNRHMYYIEEKGKLVRKTGVTTALGIKDKSEALKSYVREQTIKKLLPIFEKGEKAMLEHIASALYEDEKNTARAADLGTEIHDFIEKYIKHKLKKGEMPKMPEDKNVVSGITAFLDWEASRKKVKYVWSEKLLYSKKYGYIGTGDIGAEIDGKMCLIDLKTGNGLYNSVRAQTAAYAKADTEECGTEYVGRWAIRLSKETEKEYYERMELKNKIRNLLGKDPLEIAEYKVFEAVYFDESDLKDDFDAFLNHWNLYKWDGKTDFWKAKNK